ncbi:ATP-grasp domain-containing protein [Pseudomonas batumici]|uniref:ATP-grasp domain-containing protein n=1 Tax=Pseudomonas batumici TaxID=226910 RepID=UPI0030CAB685
MTHRQSIVVIDPISSGRLYGSEISKKGFHSVALTTRDTFPGMLDRLHCCEGFTESIKAYTFDEAIEKLNKLNIKAIIPGSDSALKLTDRLAQHYALIGNPVETQHARFNKLAMKSQLHLKGVPATQSTDISLERLLKEGSNEFEFPAIIKPAQGTGSKNVKICHNKNDIHIALTAIESANTGYLDEEKSALIEAFIDGPEYFITTASFGKNKKRQILCFAEYEKISIGNNPSVYKNIRSLPLSSEKASRAFEYTNNVNEALEVDYGINDIELKINKNGHFIIEQNGRLPGAGVPSLIEVCTGLNCYNLNIDIFLGCVHNTAQEIYYKKHFCICCLINNQAGKIQKISGISEISNLSSLHNINLLVSEGEYVQDTQDFLSTWGFVYLIHEDPEVLIEHSRIVHETLQLNYK